MRTYTKEEKQAVIERVISGEPSARILDDTGIYSNLCGIVLCLKKGA